MKSKILKPAPLFIIGLALGIIIRLLDVHTQNLGNVFSQIAIWILLGVLISIYSETKKKAMLNVFAFCIGMLASYYATAMATDGIFSYTIMIGWIVFAFCSPVFAYFTWLTKEKGLLSKVISAGIITISILSSIIFFDRLRIYDIIINALLVYFLFFKTVKR